eukprot:1183376-Prorocentrum_minimum.AAC.2
MLGYAPFTPSDGGFWHKQKRRTRTKHRWNLIFFKHASSAKSTSGVFRASPTGRIIGQSWRYFSRWILRTQLLLPGPISVQFKEYNWALNKKELSSTYAQPTATADSTTSDTTKSVTQPGRGCLG